MIWKPASYATFSKIFEQAEPSSMLIKKQIMKDYELSRQIIYISNYNRGIGT